MPKVMPAPATASLIISAMSLVANRGATATLNSLSAFGEFPAIGRGLGRGPPADAGVRRKLGRVLRDAEALAVGGRADRQLPLVAGHRDRDHVLLDHLAEADARIIALGHDVESRRR